MTQVFSEPTSMVMNVRSVIEVIFLQVEWLVFPGLLFSITSWFSIYLSTLVISLFSSHCSFQSELWLLKSPQKTTLPSMMLSQCMSTRILLLMFIPTLFHVWFAYRWFLYTFTILVPPFSFYLFISVLIVLMSGCLGS